MSPVDYHAWTHRPKELGGTDPIPTGYATLQAISSADVFVTPTVYEHNLPGNLVWGNWTTTNADILDDHTLISGDLYIFAGKIQGLYAIKVAATLIPDTGVNIETVGIQLTPEGTGSVSPGYWLYDEISTDPVQAPNVGGAYLFNTLIDVPPYDPEEVNTSLADPPTGFRGYFEIVVTTDGGDALLKESHLIVRYLGPL